MDKSEAQINDAITTIQEVLSKVSNIPFDANLNEWCQQLARYNNQFEVGADDNEALIPVGGFRCNEHGSLRLPTTNEVAAGGPAEQLSIIAARAGWTHPPTHINYGGLKTIQSMYKNRTLMQPFVAYGFDKLSDAMDIFDTLADKLSLFFPGSVALSPRWVFSGVTHATHRHALFDNLMSHETPYRYLFLHRSAEAAANFATGGNQEYGSTAAASAAGNFRFGDGIFPAASTSRTHLMQQILGNFVALGTNESDRFVGAPMGEGRDATGAFAAPYRIATNQPATDTYLTARGYSGNPGDVANPTSTAATNTLAEAAEGDNNLVYDTLTRWVLLGMPVTQPPMTDAQRLQFYANHAAVLSALALTRLAAKSNWDATFMNIAKVIDIIQNVIGQRLHNTEDVSAAQRALFTTDYVKKIKDALVKRLRKDHTLFRGKATESSIVALFDQIDRQRKTYLDNLPSTNPPRTTRFTPNGTHVYDNWSRDMSIYVPSPIVLGREAIRTYVANGNAVGTVRFIPASNTAPNSPMTVEEVNTVMAYNATPVGDEKNRQGLLEKIGLVFSAPNTNERASVLRNVKSLAFVSLSKIPYDSEREVSYNQALEAERRRQQGALSDQGRRGANAFFSVIDQDVAAEEQDLLHKRRRNNFGIDGGLPSATAPAKTAMDMFCGMTAENAVTASRFTHDELTVELTSMFSCVINFTNGAPASKLVCLAQLFTPITRQSLEASITYHFLHLLNYLVCKPYITHLTASGLKVAPGPQTGTAQFGHTIVQIGDDANTGLMSVAAKMYYGTTIVNRKNIYHIPNMMITGYLSGNGHAFINPAHHSPSDGIFGVTAEESLIVMAIPRNSHVHERFFMSGANLWSMRSGISYEVGPEGSNLSHPCADFYNMVWNFRSQVFRNAIDIQGQGGTYSANFNMNPNDMVCRATSIMVHPKTGKDKCASINTGHWKPISVGNGFRRARSGLATFNMNPPKTRLLG
jgi:hypothetical protein